MSEIIRWTGIIICLVWGTLWIGPRMFPKREEYDMINSVDKKKTISYKGQVFLLTLSKIPFVTGACNVTIETNGIRIENAFTVNPESWADNDKLIKYTTGKFDYMFHD
jgi:hypothetical protein